MASLTIEYDDREVQSALRGLINATGNPGPALKAIGEILAESTKRRFETSTGPDGQRWPENSPVTLLGHLSSFKGSFNKKRTPTGGRNLSASGIRRLAGKKPLIGETKSLSTLINYQVHGNELVVGSPMEYAAVQQFGAKRGQFGKTRRGAPIPWGDIPARPFLGVSIQDRQDILDILREGLDRASRP